MSEQPAKPSEARRPAHLTLAEVLIGVLLLAVAGFFVVRGMQQAKARAQVAAFAHAMEKFDADTVWKLCQVNRKLVHVKGSCLHWTPLHLAVIRGNIKMAEWLLNHGAEVDARDFEGGTPLLWAVGYRQVDLVELLLERGASVDAVDNNGRSTLQSAFREVNQDLAELLRKHGAKEPESPPAPSAPEK
jgi:hypothetical protein